MFFLILTKVFMDKKEIVFLENVHCIGEHRVQNLRVKKVAKVEKKERELTQDEKKAIQRKGTPE